ncbi:MAG: SUMF1/EgtB/PvdO family nonheme iron enzyme [Anaerolineae bacterium]|nr:SUMF1/EgtB/PvdO family nonheme iron enzyme [Anaerolineae bacterium]
MIWEKDSKEMIQIPAGDFLYGTERAKIYLPEYWIDKTPVTNGEYAGFVSATQYDPPYHWQGTAPPPEIGDHPVVYVSWYDAQAYATWAGKQLPSEQAWEKAARGCDGQEYTWGAAAPAVEFCNFAGKVGTTTPVGRYSPQGDSPYGCVDMAGNVWEWTDDSYDEANKVLRGGSWLSHIRHLPVTRRLALNPISYDFVFGFRCMVLSSPDEPAGE